MERRLEQRPIGVGAILLAVTAVAWLLTARFGYAAYAYVMWGSMLPTWSVLGVAGIYQLTPLKGSCLKRCRTPADFLVRRHGRGPLLLGLEHGLWCAGCCWALMFILVAVGSMSLAWAAGIAAVVLVVLALLEGVF